MSERVMLGLGEFRFEIATAAYQKFSLNQSWRWPEQARINRDPALQFVGRNVGEIDLDGVIYPSFKGGLGQIEVMRTLADKGKPQQLVDGLGRIWGMWVITEIGDTRTVFAADGQPRKLEFRVKLKAYGEDAGEKRIKSAPRLTRSTLLSPSPSNAPNPRDAFAAAIAKLSTSAANLPEITPGTTPDKLKAATSASQGVLAGIAKTVSAMSGGISGEVSNALAGLRHDVMGAIPASALQSARELQKVAGDVMSVGQQARSTVPGVIAEPALLVRDLRSIDGQLRLATYGANSALRVLRDTEQTFAAVAGLADASVVHAGIARATGTLADQAEQFASLCTQAQACTAKVREKWLV